MGTNQSPGLTWAWDRRPGELAVFEPGQELFCPAPKRTDSGAVHACGQSLHIWAGSLRMVVRPQTPGLRINGASRFHCRSCRHWSEVYPMRETLEATG